MDFPSSPHHRGVRIRKLLELPGPYDSTSFFLIALSHAFAVSAARVLDVLPRHGYGR